VQATAAAAEAAATQEILASEEDQPGVILKEVLEV
jgi:hypothetical protein